MSKKITLKLNPKLSAVKQTQILTGSVFPEKIDFLLRNNNYAIRNVKNLKIKTVLFHRDVIKSLEYIKSIKEL